ncbi:MAG: class II fructose-bisphosphate aldolase [Eubacteriales bacterium]|nr:class II fructose-bisphosphate aldolase [Eubacteriales bacterium]
MLQNTYDMLKNAQKGGYAVGAFNVENLEMAQGVTEAAKALNAPVIFQTTSSTVKYASTRVFAEMLKALIADAGITAAIHLDHGSSVELCKQAADDGYTSTMFDGSKLPFEENIRLSAQVVAYNRARNVTTEAELGAIGGKEDSTQADTAYTDPDQAVTFAQKTDVDSFAIAIGTAHGFYKGVPKLDFELLKTIRGLVKMPLVLHGASGLSDEDVATAVSLGISKVNFATELRCAYTDAVRAFLLKDQKAYDPKKYGVEGRAAVKELVIKKITVCGSAGKA